MENQDHELGFNSSAPYPAAPGSVEKEEAFLPTLVTWNCSLLPRGDCSVVEPKPGSDDAALLGLGEKPAVILMRPNGEEFARLEGDYVQEARLSSLIDLYEREEAILSARNSQTSQALSDVVKLYLAQRRLSASIVAWKELAIQKASKEACRLARQIADLALEMVRHDEAIPLLEYIRAHSLDEVARLEAWSRLIWCHLTLGDKEAASRLSNDPDRPSARLQG